MYTTKNCFMKVRKISSINTALIFLIPQMTMPIKMLYASNSEPQLELCGIFLGIIS